MSVAMALLSSIRSVCLLLLVVASLTSCAGARRQLHAVTSNEFTLFPSEQGQPRPVACSGTTDQRFDCFVKELDAAGRSLDAGGAFALAADGKIRSFARTDTLNQRALTITDATRFPAASVTKMFLAAAAVSLSLEGALDLHAPIARYLPELKSDEGVGSTTLHQLMTHTSGLANPAQCTRATEDLSDLYKVHSKDRLLAPPGAVFNYSNMGYSFVALVLERVTGKPFETVVAERVLNPAGIPGATFGLGTVAVRGHAPDGVTRMPRCRAMSPSGGLVLSVRELAQWAEQLARPATSKLGRPLLELLTAPHVKLEELPGGAYGYGVARFDHDGLTLYNHSGRLEDFGAFVVWSPERNVGAAAFSNGTEPGAVAAGLRAMSTFLSLSPDWRPSRKPAHPLSAYAGIYVDKVGTLGRLSVKLEGNALAIDYLDKPPPLLPARFRFVFEPGTPRARYVVTPVGVGERE
jgi:CubicO group peptidase (beta-lactamase class C family)